MPKLNQIIAIEDGTKKNGYADLSKTHHVLQKPDLFSGFVATYAPHTEDPTLKQPEQRKVIQQNAPEIVKLAQAGLAETSPTCRDRFDFSRNGLTRPADVMRL
jgi:hypothetical protein